MTRVSCQKIWGSIPGSPKWSDDSWRLCICKVTHPRPLPKGGESELRTIHAGFYIPYFTYSTTTPFCFQGREEWTNGNSCRPLHYLLLIFNKQCLLFPREGRMNWKQFMRAFTLFTSHSQQTTPLVSKGRENEQRAIHASFHLIYFSFSTSNDLLFPREERANWRQSIRAFTLFTSHSQQATTSCFQGRKSCFVGIDMVTWMN